MSEFSILPGTLRSTLQGMVPPSNTSIRVYSIYYSMTSTATAGATLLYLCNAKGTATSTATAQSTIYATAGYDNSMPVGIGNMDFGEGLLLPDGLFIQTPSNLNYYTLNYEGICSRM
jgi:hypothetical protein